MEINWITVAAQIVNFLVLVWLLKRFLYGPITRAMARREEAIEERLEDARQAREAAEAKQRELDGKLAELEERREDELAAARREADELRSKLEAEARETVDEKRQAWLAELDEDRGEFIGDLRTKIRGAFQDVAQSALADLAGSDLSERMAAALTAQLDDLDAHDRKKLAEGARESGRIVVESGSPLGEEARENLRRALHEQVEREIEVAFEDAGDDFVGIRVRAHSATVEWSMDEYLDRFFEDLASHFPARSEKAGAGSNDAGGAEAEKAAASGGGRA